MPLERPAPTQNHGASTLARRNTLVRTSNTHTHTHTHTHTDGESTAVERPPPPHPGVLHAGGARQIRKTYCATLSADSYSLKPRSARVYCVTAELINVFFTKYTRENQSAQMSSNKPKQIHKSSGADKFTLENLHASALKQGVARHTLHSDCSTFPR